MWSQRKIATIAIGHALFASGVMGGDPPVIKESEFEHLHARWLDAEKSFGIPGWAVVAVRDGEVILLDGQGFRNLDSKKPVTPDTMFYIASCTKAYNAMAAVALSDDGKLDLDKPVKQYLPQFHIADSKLSEKVTGRDLLCHRYGINRGEIVLRDAYTGQIDDATYFRLLGGAEAAGHTQYTNVHFTILGRVIEAVSGKHWSDYLRDRVLEPAGMTRTTAYASIMYGDDNCALPYIYDGTWRVSPVLKSDRTMHAAGGMGTTARDLGRWLLLNLNHGTIDGTAIISREGAKEMLTYQSRLPKTSGFIRIEHGFGLGWQLGEYRGKWRFAAHGGGYVGTAAYFAILPEQNAGVGVLVNAGGPGQAMQAIVAIDVLDHFLGVTKREDLLPRYKEMAPEQFRKAAQMPSGANPAQSDGLSLKPRDYIGSYSNEIFGTIRFELQSGNLTAKMGDIDFQLFSDRTDAFTAYAVPQMQYKGRFKTAEGEVRAVILIDDDDEEIHFERK